MGKNQAKKQIPSPKISIRSVTRLLWYLMSLREVKLPFKLEHRWKIIPTAKQQNQEEARWVVPDGTKLESASMSWSTSPNIHPGDTNNKQGDSGGHSNSICLFTQMFIFAQWQKHLTFTDSLWVSSAQWFVFPAQTRASPPTSSDSVSQRFQRNQRFFASSLCRQRPRLQMWVCIFGWRGKSPLHEDRKWQWHLWRAHMCHFYSSGREATCHRRLPLITRCHRVLKSESVMVTEEMEKRRNRMISSHKGKKPWLVFICHHRYDHKFARMAEFDWR